VSGSGNVAQHAVEMCLEMGASRSAPALAARTDRSTAR
jgi:hypothetical protein